MAWNAPLNLFVQTHELPEIEKHELFPGPLQIVVQGRENFQAGKRAVWALAERA